MRIAAGCAEETLRAVIRSAPMIVGHFDSSDTKIQTGEASDFLVMSGCWIYQVQDLQQESSMRLFVTD